MTTRQELVFQSAVHRRRMDPVTIEVDGKTLTLKVERPDLAQLGPTIEALRSSPEGASQSDQLRLAEEKRTGIANVIRELLADESHADWDTVQGDQGVMELTVMLNALLAEFTGLNPTQLASSSAPSSPTTEPSTPG